MELWRASTTTLSTCTRHVVSGTHGLARRKALSPFRLPSQGVHFTTATDKSNVTLSQKLPPSFSSTSGAGLPRLGTLHLVRNVVLGSVFTKPFLYKTSMAILARISNPKSRTLYPENNPLMNTLLRIFFYDHFCAGTTTTEVQRTVDKVKSDGYTGVILIPSREIMIGAAEDAESNAATENDQEVAAIEAWKELHMDTLRMIGRGDYMGMKFTGAGSAVMQRILKGQEPQPALIDAMDSLIKVAQNQGSRIWIDAEPQILQPMIDQWVVDMMRRYNRQGEPLLSNTYQAYLKSVPDTLSKHLHLAQTEGWILGIKLVRGAYIASDPRHLIHDTKPETDASYDNLADGLIARDLPGFVDQPNSPDVHVFIAGHNQASIDKSVALYKARLEAGKRCSAARWGQLQGMADEVSCSLLEKSGKIGSKTVPEVYKCLQWGTVGECMQFLLRRATENAGAAHRMADSLKVMRAELRRRMFAVFSGR